MWMFKKALDKIEKEFFGDEPETKPAEQKAPALPDAPGFFAEQKAAYEQEQRKKRIKKNKEEIVEPLRKKYGYQPKNGKSG